MKAAAIVAGLGLSVLVAGCSGGSAGNSSAPAIGHGNAAGGVATAPTAAGGVENSPALIQRGRALLDEPSAQRQIVYTAQLSLRVDDVDGAAARASSYAEAAGGFLFSERTGGTDAATADLTLKVPAGQFTSVFARLGKLGKQLSRTEQAQDVTQQVVDLTSRVGAQKASIARLEALMKQTSSVGDIVQIRASSPDGSPTWSRSRGSCRSSATRPRSPPSTCTSRPRRTTRRRPRSIIVPASSAA